MDNQECLNRVEKLESNVHNNIERINNIIRALKLEDTIGLINDIENE